jgi:hypothetical protein
MFDFGKLAYWWMKVPGLNKYVLRKISEKQMAERMDTLDLLSEFILFSPNSSGAHRDRSLLTKACIKDTIPAMASMARTTGAAKAQVITIDDLFHDEATAMRCESLSNLLIHYGSDKSGDHDYYKLYGRLLSGPVVPLSILEIGMGSNNTDVISNMGAPGRPGASLRAFRDFLPTTVIYGADIDTRILFQEDRIHTFPVDQLDQASLERLSSKTPDNIELIIDDGLHAPDANLNTMQFALSKVAPGGWIVIEDIRVEAMPLWEVVSALLPDTFRSYFIHAAGGCLFAVQRCSKNHEFVKLSR